MIGTFVCLGWLAVLLVYSNRRVERWMLPRIGEAYFTLGTLGVLVGLALGVATVTYALIGLAGGIDS